MESPFVIQIGVGSLTTTICYSKGIRIFTDTHQYVSTHALHNHYFLVNREDIYIYILPPTNAFIHSFSPNIFSSSKFS